MGTFTSASGGLDTSIARTLQQTADAYIARDADIAPMVAPSVRIATDAERIIKLAAKDLKPEALQKVVRETIATTQAALDKELAAHEAFEATLTATEDRMTRLVPNPGGGYVERPAHRELSADERDRRMALWSWLDRMPAEKRELEYYAAIASDDRETVDAIEMMPRAMSFIDDAIRAKARERKLARIDPHHAASLARSKGQLAARQHVTDQARRLLRELASR